MKVLLQRVKQASVEVDSVIVGAIDHGLLLLVGMEKHDTEEVIDKMTQKVLKYRVFGDADGKMNLSVQEIQGAILAVSQFTLAADTQKGLRPGFSKAAPPDIAKSGYEQFVERLRQSNLVIQTGVFAADMKVSLINDGPVTFMLEM